MGLNAIILLSGFDRSIIMILRYLANSIFMHVTPLGIVLVVAGCLLLAYIAIRVKRGY